MSASVVPARAGMSPMPLVAFNGSFGGPRASGDEPRNREIARFGVSWSPRERG